MYVSLKRLVLPAMLLLMTLPVHGQSSRSALTLPVAGTFGAGGEFKGTISISRFEQRAGKIVAIGMVSGVLSRANRPMGTAVAGEIAWPVTVQSGSVTLAAARGSDHLNGPTSTPGVRAVSMRAVQAQTCQVLNLALAPVNVDLLGAQVALGPVTLDVSGTPGTPLGDLVCEASELIGNVAGVVNLVNNLLALLLGLLGGLTGGIGGAIPAGLVVAGIG